jgi:hypothetical protein
MDQTTQTGGFYQMVEDKIRQWGNQVVFGGDFNPIICRDSGTQNIDWDRAGRVPNFQNSNIINGWIEDGLLLNPFRTLYHKMREIFYVSFRGRDERGGGLFGRLDWTSFGKSWDDRQGRFRV